MLIRFRIKGAPFARGERPLAPLPRVSDTAFRKCVNAKMCCTGGTRFVMPQVRDATAQILDNITLP